MYSLILFVFLSLSSAFATDAAPVVAEEAPAATAAVPVTTEVPAAEVPAAEVVAEPAATDVVVVAEEAVPAAAPTTDAEAAQAAVSVVEAFKAGQFAFGVGLALTLLVYIVNRFALQNVLSQNLVPIVAFLTGVAGATGAGLITGVPFFDALVTGIFAGVAAVGGWEAIARAFNAPAAPVAPTA